MTQSKTLVAERYRLIEPLGSGGMGRVWLASDEMLRRDVAIKEVVPPEGLTQDEREEMRLRTLREARAAARLNDPHVVRIYDVVHTEQRPWIVMEYVPSRSLHQVITEDGPLPVERVARIGLAVLGALKAAHNAGVLHRDVKPGNVLLADSGRVVLTDFGLATFEGGDGAVTRPGLILGSPQYISPERAREGVSGPESDLWSLGATLYAAVEGRSPYARSTTFATLTALATEDPDPAARAGALKPVLNALLRKDPRARADVVETERLLQRALVAGEGRAWPWSLPRQRRGKEGSKPAPTPKATPASQAPARAPQASTPQASAPTPQAPTASAPVSEPVSAPPAAAAVVPVAPEGPQQVEPPIESPSFEPAEADAPPVAESSIEASSSAQPWAAEQSSADPILAGSPSTESADAQASPPRPRIVFPGKARGSAAVPVGEPEAAAAAQVAPATPATPFEIDDERDRTVPAGHRWRWIVAAAVVVVLIVGTVMALDSSGNGRGRSSPPAASAGTSPSAGNASPPGGPVGASPTPDGSSSPSPQVQGSVGNDPVQLPPGWHYESPAEFGGWTIAVPDGWQREVDPSYAPMLYFVDPTDRRRRFGVDTTRTPPTGSAVADWQRQEAARKGRYANYRLVHIVQDNFLGEEGADWQYTYDSTGGRLHVSNHGFRMHARLGHAIYLQFPEAQWEDTKDMRGVIKSSFRPAK